VVFDLQRAFLYSHVDEARTCWRLDLSGAAVFAVALSRSRLPASPFTVQLRREPICRSCVDTPDSVIVDL
jgi:hypothetical protein